MTTERREITEADLDRLFADMAAETPVPAEDLMDRVLADAMAELPAPGGRRPMRSASRLSGALAAIGGWVGAGGLVTAGLVGLWLGVAPPSALQSETQTILSAMSPDLTSGWADYGDSL